MTRTFTIRLLLFSALLIGINIALDQAFKTFSVHNILNKRLDDQFAAYQGTLKYMSMGNSHNCVNTWILPNSFNYGSPSENYIQSYYKLKYILEKSGKKPEILLLQADLSTFGPKIANRYEYNSYWLKYIDYPELARIKGDHEVLTKWLEGKFFSYAGNYKDVQLTIVYRIKIKKLEMHNGYRPHRDYANFADVADKQRDAWNKAHLFLTPGQAFDPTIKAYFRMILELCREHGVKVILIRYPETEEMYTAESQIISPGSLYHEVTAIAGGYTSYAGILDYHSLFFGHPEYFFDPDHLNVKGSDLFTEKLTTDLGETPLTPPAR